MRYTIVLAALLMSTTSAFKAAPAQDLKSLSLIANASVNATASMAQARNDTVTPAGNVIKNVKGEIEIKVVPPTLPNPAVPAQKEMQNGEIPPLTMHDPATA